MMRLTIQNYGKIRGLAYYTDGKWHSLMFTHQKEGAIAHIDLIEETPIWYRLRLIYIQPQPESAIITIWRDGKGMAGTTLWRVEMDKGRETVLSEYWERDEFRMDRLLETIRIWLIR